MVIDTTRTKIEHQLQEKKDADHLKRKLPNCKMFNLSVDEKKWIQAFNRQLAQTMKETFGYDP